MSIKIDVLEKGENMQLKLCFKSLFDMKALGYMISGSLLYCIEFNILPCDLYNGGFLGISQIMIYVIENIIEIDLGEGNYTGIIYFLLNLPLLYISLKRFGGDFIIKTIFCVICYSVLLSIVPVPEKKFFA